MTPDEIRRRFWKHPAFQHMSDLDRTVAMFLRDGPKVNAIGLYPLSIGDMSAIMDRGVVELDEAVKRVCHYAQWSYDGTLVWLPRWWAWNLPSTEKKLASALKLLKPLPSSPLINEFLVNKSDIPTEWRRQFDRYAWDGRAYQLRVQADLIEAAESPSAIVEQVLSRWNSIVTPPIPKARTSPGTARSIRARWKTFNKIEMWDTAIRALNAEDWCRGGIKTGQFAEFIASIRTLVKSDDSFQRFLDKGIAARARQVRSIPNGCQHIPPCPTAVACTSRQLSEG